MQVRRDRGYLAAARIVAERLEDEPGSVGRRVRVSFAMLGVSDGPGLLIGGADEDLHALVALHHFERWALAFRLDRCARLCLGAVNLLLLIRRVGVIGARTWRLNRVGHRRNSNPPRLGIRLFKPDSFAAPQIDAPAGLETEIADELWPPDRQVVEMLVLEFLHIAGPSIAKDDPTRVTLVQLWASKELDREATEYPVVVREEEIGLGRVERGLDLRRDV